MDLEETGALKYDDSSLVVQLVNGYVAKKSDARAENIREIACRLSNEIGWIRSSIHKGKLKQTYSRYEMGRLIANEKVHLQNCSGVIKVISLINCYEYDFKNCHFSIASQLAESYGMDLPLIRYYAADGRTEIYKTMSEELRGTVKTFALSLLYGARLSVRSDTTISKLFGRERAEIISKDATWREFSSEISALRDAAIKHANKDELGRIVNHAGLPYLKNSNRKAKKFSHLLLGIESSALLSATKDIGNELTLLQHDGFTSKSKLNIEDMEKNVQRDTGFILRIQEELL